MIITVKNDGDASEGKVAIRKDPNGADVISAASAGGHAVRTRRGKVPVYLFFMDRGADQRGPLKDPVFHSCPCFIPPFFTLYT